MKKIMRLFMLKVRYIKFIPLQAKRAREFIEIKHKKNSHTRILGTLGCRFSPKPKLQQRLGKPLDLHLKTKNSAQLGTLSNCSNYSN